MPRRWSAMFEILPPAIVDLLIEATKQTLYMVAVAGFIGTLIGLPLGVFLATSRSGELFAAPWLNHILGLVVNAARSTPFIILVVAIIPFTGSSPAPPSAPMRPSCPDGGGGPLHRPPHRSVHPRGGSGPRGSRPRHGGDAAPDRAQGAAARSPALHHARPHPRGGEPARLLGHGRRGGRWRPRRPRQSASAISASCPT